LKIALLAFFCLPFTQINAETEILIPAPPRLAASSYILLDADSQRVLAEKNADEVLPPASLTKLLFQMLNPK
jgi:D-alanyl-D-alanine carboxypeptidase (penicillin-binding protein 5/6)